jgi:hypothetical protein
METELTLSDVDGMLRVQAGKLKVMETMVNALILTHPQPQFLREMWRTGLESLLEAVDEKGMHDDLFGRAVLDSAETVIKVVDFAADRK